MYKCKRMVNSVWFIPALMAVGWMLSQQTVAATLPSSAAVCAGCHGADGKALVPNYPNLAGQNKQYIIDQLHHFRDKSRTGGNAEIMYAMAGGLTDEQIEEIAEYFSQL